MKRVLWCCIFLLLSVSSAFAQQVAKRGVMVSPKIQASDLQVLAKWNVNYIRWQLYWSNPAITTASPAEYSAWLATALKDLDTALPTCEKLGIKVLIDLHTPPGGAVNTEQQLFKQAAYQNQFVQVWNTIAARYSGNKTVWGYDLMNEPNQGTVAAGLMNWNQVASVVAQNVRSVDKEHVIVMEADKGGGPDGFSTLVPLPVSNVVYSVHMYLPHDFTHQGIGTRTKSYRYPGIIKLKMWDKSKLRAALQPVVDFQRKYNARILVGEFSAVRYAPAGSAYLYLKDLISIFEENGWDWTYHAFREWQGWSVEHTEDKQNTKPATKMTSREKLLRQWFGKNKPQ